MRAAVLRFVASIRGAVAALAELVLPTLCPICHSRLALGSEAAICAICSLDLHHYLPSIHRGDERLYSCPRFGQLYALYAYQKGGAVQSLLHAIKYHSYLSVARYIGRSAYREFGWEASAYDLIIAVPIEPSRLRDRGYNQSLVLAKALGEQLGLEVTDRLITRRRGSHSQTSLGRIERMDNMKGAFALAPTAAERLCSRRVLLVDDVLTTGSTLLEMCYLLEEAGVRYIDVFVAAVAI